MSMELLVVSDRPENWLSLRDPRLRILIALGFALTIVSLRQVPLLLLALSFSVVLVLSTGLSPSRTFRRLLVLEGFMLVLLLLLPFSVPGEAWFRLGPMTATWEGFQQAIVILMRANAIVLALLALVGTLEPVVLGHALSRLGVPDKLAHLFLFTVRYLGLLHDEYRRLHKAMLTRGFVARGNLHTWRSLGWLVGMLLVRSLERSQRIVDAMKCRGFNGRFYLLDGQHWRWVDSLYALITVTVLSVLLLLDGMT
ncbi:MAG: cobalt ECF transporter T component CbiQ [Candidatus Thiodiazotropha sp. (ex Notomyrtea botanica)]|nr:cobalt ECF transporter T component CbiQ [Candidatus Thiodiazotropha sp. (ex Notomyrtea botanica)]